MKENGISCDRKTIPGDIAKLCDIGIDIEEERSRENRYFLSSHLFTLPEVKLLIDAVESSKFITAKKSSELANKLSQMTSVYQSEGLKRNIYISQRVKPMNEQIYYLVDNITQQSTRANKFRSCIFTITNTERKFRITTVSAIIFPLTTLCGMKIITMWSAFVKNISALQHSEWTG